MYIHPRVCHDTLVCVVSSQLGGPSIFFQLICGIYVLLLRMADRLNPLIDIRQLTMYLLITFSAYQSKFNSFFFLARFNAKQAFCTLVKLLCTKRNLCENETRELNFSVKSENTSRRFFRVMFVRVGERIPGYIISREVTA